MKEVKLTTQLNVIFTIVTLLTSLVFIVALNRVFDDFRVVQNKEQLASYFQDYGMQLQHINKHKVHYRIISTILRQFLQLC